MKILLINPPIREWSKPNVFPLGLGYIASILIDEGHKVEVMDINGYRWNPQEVEEKIKKAVFDIVGIGGLVTIYKYVKWLASIIKKYHPDKRIIIGGSVGTSIPKIMLENNPIDIVCMGEGEETIRELIRSIESEKNLSGVRGIWYKDRTGMIYETGARKAMKELDVIPFPAWDLFPMEIYLKNPVGALNMNKWVDGAAQKNVPLSMNLSATRGCPYQCIYCYHDFMGQGHRHRSATNIVKEIEILYERYGVVYFHFVDDELIASKDFVLEFCLKMKELRKRLNKDLTWGCAGRVNLMTEELIIAMKNSGCIFIGYGIETGSQKMLDLIKKRVTVEQAKRSLFWTRKHLGWADFSLMIGYPGETKETIQETIDFCKEINAVPEVIFFITPYPGTELYRMALGQGKIRDEEEYVLGLGEQGEKIRVNFTDFSNEQLYKIQSGMIEELKAWNKLRHS